MTQPVSLHGLYVPDSNTAACLCAQWSFSVRQETAELLEDLQLRHKSTGEIEAKVLREARAVRKAYKFHLLQVKETLREQQRISA